MRLKQDVLYVSEEDEKDQPTVASSEAWKKELLSIFPQVHKLNLLSSRQRPTAAKSCYKMILTDGCEIWAWAFL